MSLEEMIKLYLIKECNVVSPDEQDIEAQIKLGAEYYGSTSKLEETMCEYFNVRS